MMDLRFFKAFVHHVILKRSNTLLETKDHLGRNMSNNSKEMKEGQSSYLFILNIIVKLNDF